MGRAQGNCTELIKHNMQQQISCLTSHFSEFRARWPYNTQYSPEPERVAEDEDDDDADEDGGRLLRPALERNRPAKRGGEVKDYEVWIKFTACR